MSVIAFVPVRCGSKSIPSKNIKEFCGRPLVYWVLKALQDAKCSEKIVVASDCNEIINVVTGFGFSKVDVYKRKKENSDDHSSTESVVLEYLSFANHDENDDFILCQATSPLTRTIDIDMGFGLYKTMDFDSVLSCCRIKRLFWDETGKPINYDYTSRPRRQEFKGTLVENGAFYISKVTRILSSKNRISGKIGVFEMPEYTFFEMDEEHDWTIAEGLMKRHIFSERSQKRIKLFISDIDGVLTDAGMYYSEKGDELKKFSTYDGMGMSLLRKNGVKTGILTSEDMILNKRRAKKMQVDYLYQGVKNKLEKANELCRREKISLSEVAYIGDDMNDIELLENVGLAACPANSVEAVKKIPNIYILNKKGGEGAVREFVELLLVKIKNK